MNTNSHIILHNKLANNCKMQLHDCINFQITLLLKIKITLITKHYSMKDNNFSPQNIFWLKKNSSESVLQRSNLNDQI